MSAALLTKEAVAEICGVSVGTVRRWLDEGRIGYVKLGRLIRFPKTSVEAFLEEGRRGPLTLEQIREALDGEIEEPARSADAT